MRASKTAAAIIHTAACVGFTGRDCFVLEDLPEADERLEAPEAPFPLLDEEACEDRLLFEAAAACFFGVTCFFVPVCFLEAAGFFDPAVFFPVEVLLLAVISSRDDSELRSSISHFREDLVTLEKLQGAP
jgi:hypothetical protein